MRTMTPEEAMAFLAEGRRTATVATVRADGSPHAIPVWYTVDAGQVVFTCAARSVKGRNLARDPRAAVSVDDDTFPYSFVTVSGPVEIADRPDDFLSWTTRIAHRYLGDERAEEFGLRNEQLDDWVVRLTPTRIYGGAGVGD
jgi:PPOX class probable F420-dependent enzyme